MFLELSLKSDSNFLFQKLFLSIFDSFFQYLICCLCFYLISRNIVNISSVTGLRSVSNFSFSSSLILNSSSDVKCPQNGQTRVKNLAAFFEGCLIIWDVLHDLVSFVLFKNCEKYPWRSVTFKKAASHFMDILWLKFKGICPWNFFRRLQAFRMQWWVFPEKFCETF